MEDHRTIVRSKPVSNYTKLKNSTLRYNFNGNKLNAFQIWIFALSCQHDFKITTKFISKTFNISMKKAQRLLRVLVENNLAEVICDRKVNGGFERFYYKIYENPIGIQSEGTKYKFKLKDPLWQRKRLEIFQRDNWTCQECGDKKSTLAVHHIDYIEGIEPWEHPDNLMITLCEECHKEKHANNSNQPVVWHSDL